MSTSKTAFSEFEMHIIAALVIINQVAEAKFAV